jgi:hypothetical protein
MVTTRQAFAVVLALACVAVLAARVPLEFSRIRFRVVPEPMPAAQTPSVAVALPDLSTLADAPAAVVIRIQGGEQPATLNIALDDGRIADVVVPPRDEIRVDASAIVPRGENHQLLVTGDRPGWRITYLEIANVHGFSSGLVEFQIVPRAYRRFDTLRPWALILVFLGLLALGPRPDWPATRPGRRLYAAFAGVVLLLFLGALTADRFTPYKLLVMPKGFAVCAAILYAERVLQGARATARATIATGRATLPILVAACRRTARGMAEAAAIPWLPAALVLATSTIVWGITMAVGTHGAGGADSYGYVSESELWAKGQLYVDQPIVAELPDYTTQWLLAPLGWVPQEHARVRGRIVPVYSPGLPMLMAPMRILFGADGVYVVVPILAALTIWLTFLLGRRLDGDATGLFAALWLASSPGILGSAFSPMSDVPVTTWWLAALVAALNPATTARSATVAGLATTLAVLTRPNLAPLGAVVALPFLYRLAAERKTWRPAARNLAVFAVTAAIGPAVVAALFNYWYGSPFRSGYGATDSLFSWAYLTANLQRYPRWLIESQTALIVVGLITPLLVRGRSATQSVPPVVTTCVLLTMCVVSWAAYMTYFPFDDWGYLRFLLPSYPPLIVLSSTAFVVMLRRTKAPRLLGTALLALIMTAGLDFGRRAAIFTMFHGETRYERAGDYIAANLPERAVIMSMQHSGSLRYYSGRTTIRYDLLRPSRLDQFVEHFTSRGYPVFFVLDDWEEPEFRRRFAELNVLGKLDWPPIARAKGINPVAIYDPRNRQAEKPIATRKIP